MRHLLKDIKQSFNILVSVFSDDLERSEEFSGEELELFL
jgi:hypothetical protein